jgi:hypothetical protein
LILGTRVAQASIRCVSAVGRGARERPNPDEPSEKPRRSGAHHVDGSINSCAARSRDRRARCPAGPAWRVGAAECKDLEHRSIFYIYSMRLPKYMKWRRGQCKVNRRVSGMLRVYRPRRSSHWIACFDAALGRRGRAERRSAGSCHPGQRARRQPLGSAQVRNRLGIWCACTIRPVPRRRARSLSTIPMRMPSWRR